MAENAIPEEWESYLKNLFVAELRARTRTEQGTVSTVSRFSKYTKEKISDYLKNPQNNEKPLRDASIYMYANSTHYYNLINFHALMPTWAYTLAPLKFDEQTIDPETFYKQYLKVMQKVQTMNLSHEMISVFRTCFREDVYYGVIYETKDAFFLQKLNPDWCRISAIVDGTYVFEFDFSQIREENLVEYPDFFASMWNQYQNDSELRWQEIPADQSMCLKVNQDLLYPLPPFAGSMPLLYDIEDYKDLIKQREEIFNYKALNAEIPVDAGGSPLIESDITQAYYNLMARELPDGVGLMMSPFKMSSFQFEKTGLTDTDEVANAELRFWSSTGTSPLLFGSGKDSVTALKYSIKANEQIVLALMRQAERWVNRKLKTISGKIKFRMNILPVTHFNIDEKVTQYKEAGTYGLPVKSQYAVLQDMEFGDIDGMLYLENEILQFPDKFRPLSSSYTQTGEGDASADEGGRPTNEEQGKDLTEAGEQTQRDDENANRE